MQKRARALIFAALLFLGAGAGARAEATELATPVDYLKRNGVDFMADASKEELDFLLVVAVDVSGSISDSPLTGPLSEYQLQKKGIVETLKDREVRQALEQCSPMGIGLTYVEWSGSWNAEETEVQQAVPWRKITNGEELAGFANEVNESTRAYAHYTDIITALTQSVRLLVEAPFRSSRLLINVSGDGRQRATVGPGFRTDEVGQHVLLATTRDRIVEAGITINGLAIEQSREEGRRELAAYYASNVQGGAGSFTKSVGSFEDYADEFKQMLLLELRTCGY